MGNLTIPKDGMVLCPLAGHKIEIIDCIENVDIVDDMLSERGMPEKWKQQPNWKDICRRCKYYNY